MKGYWNQICAMLEARKQEERALLLLAVLAVLGYLGFVLLIEPLQNEQADIERRITVAKAQIIEESNKQAEINATYTDDPNSFARRRQVELQAANSEADQELDELYGRLIDPSEMSRMLTRILQRETTLELVSLNNKPSEMLLTTSISASVDAAGRQRAVEVFRHGLQMVFEGSYLETIRYLRSLEQLENNFFWENMDYRVTEYPNARITLDIYTLSTQRGWIGV